MAIDSLATDVLFGDKATVNNRKTTDAGQHDVLENFRTQRRYIDQTQLSRFQQCLAMFTPQSTLLEHNKCRENLMFSFLIRAKHALSISQLLTAADDRISYFSPIIPVTMLAMTFPTHNFITFYKMRCRCSKTKN